MREFYNGKSLEDGSIEGQQALLLDIQEHLLDDRYSGLMDRANDIVALSESAEELLKDCDLVRPVAHVRGQTSVKGAFYEGYYLTFTGTTFVKGRVQRKSFDVPVAQAIGDLVWPINGFSDEEAELFADHIDVIRCAKKEGLLPNLSPDLSRVPEPLAPITWKPLGPK